jgi:exodeoxyribonuclease VII large subunit
MDNVYSVGQVNKYIKNMFVTDYLLKRISVRGEVSNCKYITSGHIFFTLKDTDGNLKCVMFAGNRGGLSFRLTDGMQVVVTGSIDVYAQDGVYQLYATRIEQEGAGELYERFMQLKEDLEERGMFAAQYKQEIPSNPQTIGIVTAPTGAAVRDIINIATRRNPYIRLILYPATVQGAEAPRSIVKGIKALEKYGVDVMIVGRGGGSIEDLWGFNEECVAQAIFDCSIPIISAVGHETDFTIADFVADLRAPTPSAAAELAVRKLSDIDDEIDARRQALYDSVSALIRRDRERLRLSHTRLGFLSPAYKIKESGERLARAQEKLHDNMLSLIKERKSRLGLLSSGLEGNSPLKKIAGGFAYVEDSKGKRVKSAAQLKAGDDINMTFSDGKVKASVAETIIKKTDDQ